MRRRSSVPDAAGTRLILISDLGRPDALTTALRSEGERVGARYTKPQAVGEFNGRETPNNFDQLPGKVYALDGRVDPEGICFIANPLLLTGARVMRVAPVSTGLGGCPARERLAQLRSRAVVNCFPIALVDGRVHIVLVEFERRGTNALASRRPAGWPAAIFRTTGRNIAALARTCGVSRTRASSGRRAFA